ncbi:inositol monophosphatase family protein [Xenorhabdus cabanillasii]|uniref:Inositol-1-monophosphatase n=2 Tax=Xenorhabdus cabanillasii TaxID=351673 RepID=W1J9I1_9GAMM|nr:inositol monophosphatase [Xenorhabdus cabanillasii]PHM78648.1 inositol monophosphatase [Xenorhabdus cabanillasii JM26]CDL86516.1 Inositol-1-monophosphatase [Xenorhabdus cabanillasii JM26]
MLMDERFLHAKQVIANAGNILLEMFNNLAFTCKYKKEKDVLTSADLIVDEYIKRSISDIFPGDTIISEESSFYSIADTSEYTWIIDPIDGTHSFSTGVFGWCISIAAFRKGSILFGLTYDPIRKECFSAYHGQGAFLNSTRLFAKTHLLLEHDPVPYLAFGTSYRDDKRKISKVLTRLLESGYLPYTNGSAALCMSYVAANRLLAFFELNLYQWDVAAGYIILKEAGFQVHYSFNDINSAQALICGNHDIVKIIESEIF